MSVIEAMQQGGVGAGGGHAVASILASVGGVPAPGVVV